MWRCLCLLALCVGFNARAAVVELQAQAMQRGSVLTLRDIARVSGTQRECDVLNMLELPARGRVGDTVIYTSADVARRIAQAQPALAVQLRMAGAGRTEVTRRGRELAASDYVATAQAQLLARTVVSEGHVSVSPAGEYPSLAIPEGTAQVNARIEAGAVRSRMRVWLDIAVDGRPYTSVPVTFDVQWRRRGLILQRAQKAKSPLAPESAQVAEVDAAQSGGDVLVDALQLTGKRLRHDMAAGSALRTSDIEDKPPVEAGASIDVLSRVGSVVVQTRAVAERDGFVGQRIGTRTVRDNEILMVEVIGEDRAMVSSNTPR